MLDLSAEQCASVLGEIDMRRLRLQVFELFNICPGLDADLSMHKVQVLEDDDEQFSGYCVIQDSVHQQFL